MAGRLQVGNSMSLANINSNAFTAHLYLDGRPVVLNQQRLQQALRDLRITQGEKLDAEVGLADPRVSSLITLADHEEDNPLLLKFVPQGDNYAISLVHPGTFDGARLFIEDNTHNLLASTRAPVQYFSFSTYGVRRASLRHIQPGPAYLELISEPNDQPLYRHISSGMSTFLNKDPNMTGHNAFNNKPATFVIKVLK
jgi:aromatic ring-cleaving dioxygenase